MCLNLNFHIKKELLCMPFNIFFFPLSTLYVVGHFYWRITCIQKNTRIVLELKEFSQHEQPDTNST